VSKLDQRSLDDAVWFVRTQTSASDATKRGYVFEVLVHRFFGRGGTAVLRRLSPGGTAAEQAGQKIVVPPRRHHMFSRLGAPADQQGPQWNAQTYNRPSSKTFCAVDAAVFPDMLIQSTVAMSHPIKMAGVLALLDALAAAGAGPPHMIKYVFVVPIGQLSAFTQQPYHSEAGTVAQRVPPRIGDFVVQYALGLDLHTEFSVRPTK
jgi:hypothetical protein